MLKRVSDTIANKLPYWILIGQLFCIGLRRAAATGNAITNCCKFQYCYDTDIWKTLQWFCPLASSCVSSVTGEFGSEREQQNGKKVS